MNCDKVKELLWRIWKTKPRQRKQQKSKRIWKAVRLAEKSWRSRRKSKTLWRCLPDEELPEGYHTELMQKLQAERKIVPFPAKKKHGWKQMSMIAAAVLVVVVAGGTRGMLEMRQNQNEEIEQILFENTALTADTGEEAAEQIAADSATENNAAGKIRYQGGFF